MRRLFRLAVLTMVLGSLGSLGGWSEALAQGAKKGGGGRKPAKGVRERHISREATIKGKDQKNIDFDAADIGGQRKTPMGTLVNSSKSDKEYDFVKIRLRWHPEMVQSASSLDSGKSR